MDYTSVLLIINVGNLTQALPSISLLLNRTAKQINLHIPIKTAPNKNFLSWAVVWWNSW